MTLRDLTCTLILALSGQVIAVGQTSFWTPSVVPATQETNDGASISVGLKFYSDIDGTVTGLRFYKGRANKGNHAGTLWSSTGAKLASVNFSGETASGWQQASFAAPVSVQANTTYVISYFAPKGFYSTSGGPYTQIAFVGGTSYLDSSVAAGQTYFYTATAVNGTSNESSYATQAVAVIPIP